MAKFIYRSAQDHLNNEVYRLIVLEGYNLQIPEVYADGIPEPEVDNIGTFRTGAFLSGQPTEKTVVGGLPAMPTRRLREDWAKRRFTMRPIYQAPASHKVKANLTIAHMVDMAYLNLFFEFREDYDVLEVFHMLDAYLTEIRPLVQANAQGVAVYARKVLGFRAKLFKLVTRLLNMDQDWRDAYWNQVGVSASGKTKQILDFIALIDPGAQVNQFDPMVRLKTPPYRIDDNNRLIDDRTNGLGGVMRRQTTEAEIASGLVNGVSNVQYGSRRK